MELTGFKCQSPKCGFIFDANSEVAPLSCHCPLCGKKAEWYDGERPKLMSRFFGQVCWLILSHSFCLYVGYKMGQAIANLP